MNTTTMKTLSTPLPAYLVKFEGNLFDTRKPNWTAHPVRKGYTGAKHRISTTAQLKAALREPYAWPGGYECVYITGDGCLLCHDCVVKNIRSALWSIRHRCSDGWRIVEVAAEAVSAEMSRKTDESLVSYCDHCSREFGELM